MKLGMERLCLLLDRQLNQEDIHLIRPINQDMPEGIPLGSQVLMVKNTKKSKLDSTYIDKIFTVVGRYHKNTYVLIDDKGRKLKRAVNAARLKVFIPRKNKKTFNHGRRR
ncbi:hypothetical protein BD560DRAFT_334897 [Blakeslea trispora]|nr:hypothetical protein BD560DRAFT_334897 [Blakeslea trispora]